MNKEKSLNPIFKFDKLRLKPYQIVIIILLSSAILLSAYTFLANKGSEVSDETSVAQVEIEILESPKEIATMCDRITIKVSVTNSGDIDITYSDITDGVYDFSVIVGTISAWDSSRGMQVSDFGTLAIGETKEVIFTGGREVGTPEYGYHDNEFHGPDDNGTFSMKITLYEPDVEEDNTYVVRGESDPVDLITSIYEDPSQNLLKSCDGF